MACYVIYVLNILRYLCSSFQFFRNIVIPGQLALINQRYQTGPRSVMQRLHQLLPWFFLADCIRIIILFIPLGGEFNRRDGNPLNYDFPLLTVKKTSKQISHMQCNQLFFFPFFVKAFPTLVSTEMFWMGRWGGMAFSRLLLLASSSLCFLQCLFNSCQKEVSGDSSCPDSE